jgi:hypothetical protein
MSRAPVLTAILAVAALAAAPVSLHFEGNQGTAEPFLFVFPFAALVAGIGTVVALSRRLAVLAGLNALATIGIVLFWVALLTYEGR